MKKKFVILIAFSIICISILSGCTQPGNQSGNSVTIQNFAFNPNSLSVSVGTNVTWTNMDNVDHQIKSDTGLFESNPFSNGQTYTYQFTTAGTYSYTCLIHPSMHGTIIVK